MTAAYTLLVVMAFAVGLLFVAVLHWHGVVSQEQADERAALDERARNLVRLEMRYADELAAREAEQ